MPAKRARRKAAPRKATATRQKSARKKVAHKKRPAARSATSAATKAGVDMQVYINIPGEAQPFALLLPDNPRQVQALAQKWSYSLRNRERWAGRPDLLEKHRAEISQVATTCGLNEAILAKIAAKDLVEISIPFVDEEIGWELRIMPWEYLLSTATREMRGTRGLTVVRHLRREGAAKRKLDASLPSPVQWLHVECAPGKLRDGFDFSSERDLVREAAKEAAVEVGGKATAKGAKTKPKSEQPAFVTIRDPDEGRLSEAFTALPDAGVVHVSGFDPHQGLQLLDDPEADRVLDGILVRLPRGAEQTDDERTPSPSSRVAVVAAWKLSHLLTARGRTPRLIAFNVYHSAARSAAACVAYGAEAAIGFQDSFDDTLAELFYATFYTSWRLSGWNTVAAFHHAWQYVRSQNQPLHGSGAVLWSARSIRETLPGYWAKGDKLDTSEINSKWDEALKREPVVLTAENIREHVEIDVQPLAALNYSILHNDGSLFERFTIRKTSMKVGRVQNLHVKVELHVGTDSFPYRQTLELGERQMQTDLAQHIRISLASALSRGLRESVRTSLFVAVMWGKVAVRRETFPITLLPIDEWVDTDDNRIWLPSFVLPRDPAVHRVIDRAQRYLMAIADDPSMGFSGYQSVDTDLPDDDPPADRCAGVDAQVRAIWSSLLYELPLSYINPPPVFSDYSQRLRTPSDVVDGKRGTCIDLALLLASCLEYVEIYPVVFLLTDHAFPGYWRDEAYYDDFVGALGDARVEPKPGTDIKAGQRYSWYLERAHFTEILAEVHAGRLVPLETVALTDHTGFADAMDRGNGNLTSRRQFQAMLDIISARWDDKNRVTPLPLLPREVRS